MMKIAILGFGTVGSGVYEILSENASLYTSQVEVSSILIRKEKKKTLPIMVDDIESIINDPTIETVVEVMGGLEPAHSYIRKCLEHHKHVVTANKAVVAKFLYEFITLAENNHVSFLFEASTGGGIPWLHAIENVKRIDTVTKLHGIFNGTSNYILDHMYKDNVEFDQILHKAQDLGYAEADPSADIDGFDIRNKLQISASLAFNSFVSDCFPIFGIRNIAKVDIEFFKERGLVLKLIASAQATHDHYHCMIEPCLYPTASLEANVSENYNLASIHGETIGDLKFYGQGAGKLPTANAVIQDIIDIIDQKAVNLQLYKKMVYKPSLEKKRYFLRSCLATSRIQEYFQNISIEHIQFQNISYYLISQITTDHMHAIMKYLVQEDAKAMMASWEVTDD